MYHMLQKMLHKWPPPPLPSLLPPSSSGKHVVFGKVVSGLDVLERVDECAASADGSPLMDVTITDCGLLP